MRMNQNIPYYLGAIAIFMLLKFGYTVAGNTELFFLLKPTDKIICLVTNSNSQFIADSGFFHERLNIVIDKSCSGFNFWIMCFLMLSFLVCKYLKGRVQKILALPSLLVVAYFLTVFVNSSRILFSVFTNNSDLTSLTGQLSWLHEAEGAFIYLSFLITIYLAFSFLLKSTEKIKYKCMIR